MESNVYQTQDQPICLKIRVELRKVCPTNAFIQSVRSPSQETLVQHQTIEKCNFGWQEKVFSKKEMDFYRDNSHCVSYLDKKYHHIVTSPKYEVERKSKRLHSLIQSDIQEGSHKLEVNLSPPSSDNSILETQRSLKRRNVGKLMRNPDLGQQSSGIVIPSPNEQNKFPNRHSTQTMYILADIQPEENVPSDPEDVVLCRVEWNSSTGAMTISPDFNSWKEPYTLHNKRLDSFEYVLEHASPAMTSEELIREKHIISSLLNQSKLAREKQVGHVFEMPHPDVLKVYLFGEIESANGFGDCNLHVCFSVHLPKGWVCLDPSWLNGITQKCKPKVDGLEDSSYFSFPFEGELSFQYQKALQESDDVPLKWPIIFVEVWSTDCWGCLRTEGCGYSNVPRSPGCHVLKISTWRCVPTSNRSRLERFFIGGQADMDDLAFIAVPETVQGRQLSKFGFHSESRGSVNIRLNLVHQAESFLNHLPKKQSLLDKLGLSAAENSLEAILAAFNRARQRMLAARANLS